MRKLVAVTAAFLILGCLDQAPFQPDPAEAPELAVALEPGGQGDVVKMVPFKVEGTFWRPAEGDATPCAGLAGAIAVFLAWEGTGTHLGYHTGTGTNCVRIGADGSRLLLSQTATFHAANGDLLFAFGSADQDGTGMIIYPDNTWRIGPVPIVGGTGRLENARGWFHTVGENPMGGAFAMEGCISSVGSSK
jgi:hypothetical protein